MVRYWKHRGAAVFKRLKPHIQKYFPFHKPELKKVSAQKALLSGRKIAAPFELAIGHVVPLGPNAFENTIKVQLHKLCLNRFLLRVSYSSVCI